MTKDEATKLMDEALDRLGEHFSSVQIVATNCEGNDTNHYSRGSGDFYARRGACDKWLRDDDAEDATYVKLRMEKEDDRDDWRQ